ncbi:ATP-binding protein [Chlorobium sp. N1]|uniref:two-component system sensor histidine kinase NtrB n=1 Tax=Chlorobium sp. N1 TaxID=2491138 RepID=UPI00103D65F4|nr:ATP-binding protein [Chlorobium sp. N1]TCD47332.1 PAS domain-containing protein [Chlorobium sp. N1]
MRRIFSAQALRAVNPRQLAMLFVLLLGAFSATAVFEYQSRRSELEHLMHEESSILVQALKSSAETSLESYQELNAMVEEGALEGNIDAVRLLRLRRELGPGRLIQRIGADDAGIEYIIWQDSTAIISATTNVTDTESIQSDPVLSAATAQPGPTTRLTTFGGRKVFEVISPFSFQGTSLGVIRIGLDASHLATASGRLRTRLLMLLALALLGGLAIFSLMASQINERRLASACRKEQLFSEAILSGMADAVVATDAEGRIRLLNTAAAKLLGLSAGEALGKPLEAFLPEIAGELERQAEGNDAPRAAESSCTINDRTLIISGSYSRLEGDGGEKGGAVAVLRDITRERSMQEAVERKEKLTAMGELASGVAHEIRNPLNAIGLIGQRLDMEFEPAESGAEYHALAGSVVREVRRVDAIIQRFLRFARPPGLKAEQTRIEEWLGDCRPLLEAEAAARNSVLELETPPPCTASIDRDQLLQALLNLVRNASEASLPGGAVRITCREEERVLEIEVADEGKGIAAAELSRVFNLYYTTKQDGTGLGLSITNQIVQSHGGAMRAASTPGRGSTFTIVLPTA